jgi:hypothetical protein
MEQEFDASAEENVREERRWIFGGKLPSKK